MALVEQAVFTSAQTDRSDGYQLVAASPGLSEADARELAVWGPSHGSLLQPGPDAASFNFHPLPSGAHCVSRTTSAGWEYSGRGAARVYTQCLVVPEPVFARFANNPFAVLRAAMANGSLVVHRDVPKQLAPIPLVGRSASVDSLLLARLCTEPGPEPLATLLQAALGSNRLALCGKPAVEHLIAGLMNCLPPECRTEFSFSTGLRHSSRRPFRIVRLTDDTAERRRMRNQHDWTVLEVGDAAADEFAPLDGWARFIELVLRSSRTAFLTAQFSKRRFSLAAKDLPALGLQLLEELDAASLPAPRPEEPTDKPPAAGDWLDTLQRAHAPHQRFRGAATDTKTAKRKAAGPSRRLGVKDTPVLEKLELLDDLVFGAIDGNAAALAQLQTLWPSLHEELGDPLLAESREQYLRHALLIWEESTAPSGTRDPARAVQALDVLCVLFDES
jgi:hypothetical protein